MPARITVTIPTTNAQTLTSISAGVSGVGLGLLLLNFLLQDGGNQVLRTGLREQTSRLLTFRQVELVRVLAGVSVSVLASNQYQHSQQQESHGHWISLPTILAFRISFTSRSCFSFKLRITTPMVMQRIMVMVIRSPTMRAVRSADAIGSSTIPPLFREPELETPRVPLSCP